MKKIFFGLFASLVLFGGAAHATSYSPSQLRILAIGRAEGMLHGNFPETMQAIALQETQAGKIGRTQYGIIGDLDRPPNERSYGAWQVKLQTAKDYLRKTGRIKSFTKYGRVIDEEIIVALMTNPTFCGTVAAYHFHHLYLRYKSWDAAVRAYNAGHDCSAGEDYLENVKKKLGKVRKLEEQ